MKQSFTSSFFVKKSFVFTYALCCLSVFNFTFAAPILQAKEANKQLISHQISLVNSNFYKNNTRVDEESFSIFNQKSKVNNKTNENISAQPIKVNQSNNENQAFTSLELTSAPNFSIDEIKDEGVIGIFGDYSFDNPSDNVFKFQIENNIGDDDIIWLSYKVFGVDDVNSISNSINSTSNRGGYLVKLKNEWSIINEPIHSSMLFNGDNYIRFSVNPNAIYGYKVKDIQVSTASIEEAPIVMTNSEIKFEKNNKTYIRGVAKKTVEYVYVNGQKLYVDDYQNFEGFVNITDEDKKNGKIDLKAIYKNGEEYNEVLKISPNLTEADYEFNISPSFPNIKKTFNVLGDALSAYGSEFSLPEGAISKELEISISELRKIDLAPLNSGLHNVTPNQKGYRFLPFGSKFQKEGRVSLPFDPNLVPSGNSVGDIRTYYFDNDQGQWIALELDSIDIENQLIISKTDHFTDMINGVIEVPESPETNAFAPTMMSDIKAANPTAGINIMQPPTASQDGAAHISYPIVIPPGRNGMQPNLSIQYNSEGGNGWMGLGWNISSSAITIDTRWGVPEFHPTKESEIYTLNGEQLVYPKNDGFDAPYMPNRHGVDENGFLQTVGYNQSRSSDKMFFLRKADVGTKIIRKGSSSANYYWEVTNSNGAINYYGSTSDSKLKDNNGNVVHWALAKTVDIYGNEVVYEYNTDIIPTINSGVNKNLSGGKQLYLKNIKYSLKNGNENSSHYLITFINDTSGATFQREDIEINGRLGFKQVKARRLKEIKIEFKENSQSNSLIRTYSFNYITGEFGKTLLKEIVEKDNENNEVYKHSLRYHNMVSKGESGAIYFGDVEQHMDNLTEIENPGFPHITSAFSGKGTALGSSVSDNWVAGGYLGLVGLGANPLSVNTTVGFTSDIGGGKNTSFVGLMDIDGDGLTDKVYRKNGTLKYKKHTIEKVYEDGLPRFKHKFSDNLLPINQMDNFYRSVDKFSVNKGFGINFPKGSAFINFTKSKSETNVFVTDANGDMLPDIVHNGVVYFNRLNENGVPTFSPSSQETENMIVSAEVGVEVPETDFDSDEEDRYDIVKYWIGEPNKYGGMVSKIIGIASFEPLNENSYARISIEVTNPMTAVNCMLFQHTLTYQNPSVNISLDLSNHSPSQSPPCGFDFHEFNNYASGKTASPIFFRVNANGKEKNTVTWNPQLIRSDFVSGSPINEFDENGLNHPNHTKYSDGFLLNGNGEVVVTGTSKVQISWPDLSINSLSDDVKFEILKTTFNTEDEEPSIPEQIIGEVIINSGDNFIFKSSNYPVLSNLILDPEEIVRFSFRVTSDSNVDWKSVNWKPEISYTVDAINENIINYPIPEYSVYKHFIFEGKTILAHNYSVPSWIPSDYDNKIYLAQNWTDIISSYLNSEDSGEINIIAKNQGKLIGKRKVKIKEGAILYNESQLNDILLFDGKINDPSTLNDRIITIEITPGDSYSQKLVKKLGLINYTYSNYHGERLLMLKSNTGITTPYFYENYYIMAKNGLGASYLNWGQFVYDPSLASPGTPVDEYGIKLIDSSVVNSMEINIPNDGAVEEDIIPILPPEDGFENLEDLEAYLQQLQNSLPWGSNGSSTTLLPKRSKNANNEYIEEWVNSYPNMFASETQMNSNWDYVNPNEPEPDENEEYHYQGPMDFGAYSINKVNTSKGKSWSLGFAGIGSSGSSGENKTYSDYIDLNGDKYPDILTTETIQLTQSLGGLKTSNPFSHGVDKTKSSGKGMSAGGQKLISGVATGDAKGKGNTQNNNGKTSTDGASATLSGSFSKGDNEIKETWIDVNGDGLPDKVYDNGVVELNLGNHQNFVETHWNEVLLSESSNETFGAGVGINLWNGSLEAGLSGSKTIGNEDVQLIDMNGDGLPDLVYAVPIIGYLLVQINYGNKFGPPIYWKQAQNHILNLDKSTETVNGSLNGAVNGCGIIPLLFITVKFGCVNVKYSQGKAVNKTLKTISDFNGDGFPDFLVSDNNQITVYPSTIGKTNLLESVTNPIGGSFHIDFDVTGNTYELPMGKWVLSKVKIYPKDPFFPEKHYTKFFKYEDGYYDRREREFYGFETVKIIDLVEEANIDNYDEVEPNAYRTQINRYHNRSYFLKGALKESYMIKGSYSSNNGYIDIPTNQLFSKSVNTYQLNAIDDNYKRDVNTVLPLDFDTGGSEGRNTAIATLKQTDNYIYELNPNPIHSKQIFTYDELGRVTKLENFGDVNVSGDEYVSMVNYHDIPALTERNILSVPKEIIVKESENSSEYIRKRTTENIDNLTGAIGTIKAWYKDENDNEVFAQTDMLYNDDGNLVKITYPENMNGHRVHLQYEYDNIIRSYPVKVTDNMGYFSTSEFEFKYGNLTKAIDTNGNEVLYEYDSMGRLTKVKGPKDPEYTLKFEYHPENKYAITKHYDSQNAGNPIETYTFVDGIGRVRQVKKDYDERILDNNTPNERMSVSGKVEYDSYNRIIKEYQPQAQNKDDNDIFTVLINDFEHPTITTYDELDRVIQVDLPENGHTSFMEYGIDTDGFGNRQLKVKTIVNQSQQQQLITESFTDTNGRTTSTKNHTDNQPIWTKYRYDNIGQLIEVEDAEQNTITSIYDQLGRRVQMSHPDAGVNQYWYDSAGNLTKMQTPNLLNYNVNSDDRFIKYNYDELNRLLSITYPPIPSTGNLNDVRYVYGDANETTPNAKGKLIEQYDATGRQTFEYGNMGELTKVSRWIIAPNLPNRKFVHQYEYDSFNRLLKITYPDSEEVSYLYDLGGNLLSMKGTINSQEHSYIKQITYDHFEQRTAIKYGNNTVNTYTYDPKLRRLENMKTKHFNNILLNNHYSYDFVGNIKSFENTAGATSNKMAGDFSYTYTYDKLNRLKTANGNFSGYSGAPAPTFGDLSANYTLAMEYDNLHNITHKIQQHYKNNILFNENSYKNQYNYSQDKPHQLESIQDGNTTEYFGYDPNGNLHRHTSVDEDWVYFWDEANRLRSAVFNGVKMMHYIYDASGERTLKAQTEYQGVFENGTPTDEGSTLTVYTTYPSPYLTISPDKKFTNHYYAGSQRIASKPAGNADRFNVLQVGDTPDLEELRAKQLADAQLVADSMELGQLNLAQPGSGIIIIPAVFYFHPDHLGSSTLITDNFGDPYQFFLNLPFGETFAEQRRSGSFDNPYKFNGKELDEETGLYYYGARYYNPRTSVFISVDPLTEQTMTPYQYTYQNPVKYVDPTGMAAVDNDWDNPVYGSDGTYRGNTKEGFTGEILIYDGDKEFSKMSALELEISGANKYDDTVLSNSAIEKIWTHIASNYEGVGIYDEVFSLKDLEGNKIHYNKNINANWISSFYLSSGEGKISGSNLYSYESTVENIASSIIVHEWYSHIKKENRDGMKSHRLAYKNVINFKALWDKTTDAYKGFNMRQLRFYTEKETGRKNVDPLYQNLYNKYHNKY